MSHRIVVSGHAAWALVAVVLFVLTPVQPAGATMAMPCGDTMAPTCEGLCPTGLRCVSTGQVVIAVAVDNTGTASPALPAPGLADDECTCVEVLCGGVPLQNNQSCCNGVPFTLGSQGCCNGEVVPANTTCTGCGGFPATSCCTSEGAQATSTAAFGACCTKPNFAAAYTLNSHLDCCPNDEADLCLGTCRQGMCATSDCCDCEMCGETQTESQCAEPGLAECTSPSGFCAVVIIGEFGDDFGCPLACGLAGCSLENTTRSELAACGAAGCATLAEPAPAASNYGLVSMVLVLLAVGAWPLLRNRRVRGYLGLL